jgi:hypothetical protein
MTRYCPKCGEPVSSNSITCPKCYTKLPPEPPKKAEGTYGGDSSGGTGTRKVDRKILAALTIIPGFFGILGLGQIYRDYRVLRGYIYLLLGLVLFVSGNALLLSIFPDLIVGVVKTIAGVGILFLYAILFLITIIDSLMSYSIVVRR